MTNLIPFQFENQQVRSLLDEHGEPWFIAKDIAEILEYSDTFEMTKKLDDDEIQNLQIAGFGNRGVTIINESGMYSSILSSKKPTAKPFKKWVTSEVLPSIRKIGKYEVPKKASASPSMKDSLLFLKESAKMLRMSETSVNKGLRVIADVYNMPSGLLPSYSTEGLVQSLSDLLKSHNIPMSAVTANKILIEKGYLTVLQRRTSGNKMEDFKSITEKGLKYGRNDTPPECPNKTNPQWYVDKFSELAEILIKSSDEKSAK